MKLWKIETTTGKHQFTDWYEGEKEQAIEAWREDCHRYGLPADAAFTISEVNPETLQPINS